MTHDFLLFPFAVSSRVILGDIVHPRPTGINNIFFKAFIQKNYANDFRLASITVMPATIRVSFSFSTE